MTRFVLVAWRFQHQVMIFYTEIRLLPKSEFHGNFPEKSGMNRP